jgi:hypothetical protein
VLVVLERDGVNGPCGRRKWLRIVGRAFPLSAGLASLIDELHPAAKRKSRSMEFGVQQPGVSRSEPSALTRRRIGQEAQLVLDRR